MRGRNRPRPVFVYRFRLRVHAQGWPWLPWNRAWRADLSAYADGELSPAERARVEADLDASSERREWLADVQHVQESFAVLSTPELPRSYELSEAQFAAALASDAQPVDDRSSATRATPLRLATAGAVASLVALATISGFDMLDDPAGSSPLAAPAEPTATAVTTGAGSNSQSSSQAAETSAGPAATSDVDSEQVVTVAAAPNEQAQQSATAARAQEPEPATTQSAVAETESEQAEQAAQAQAQYEQQAQQAPADDTPPAMTPEQQEAARDPARGAVTAGISSDQSQSDSADPTIAARDDDGQAVQTDEADAAVTETASDEAQVEATEPTASAAESQADRADQITESEPRGQPTAASETSGESDAPQPVRVVIVSTSDQDDAGSRRIAIPRADQQTVQRDSERSADPDDWPIPARPEVAGEVHAADPSWETPVQIALAAVAFVALLLWAFLWILGRRRAI